MKNVIFAWLKPSSDVILFSEMQLLVQTPAMSLNIRRSSVYNERCEGKCNLEDP